VNSLYYVDQMRLTVFVEPQFGATYDDQLRIARHAEACGYDAFFRSDHFLTMNDGGGLPGPTESWVTLAGLARETRRIRLGTMVTSATFRLPGPLAIAVAQVDAMSGGRVELGLGAGWFEAEHEAYGVPFPPIRERFDRLAEQFAIVTGLWSAPAGQSFSFQGAYYDVRDSPALPKPVQSPGPTVIVGGRGARRTPALAARYADEYNVPFTSVAETARCYQRVVAACASGGRDHAGRAPLVFSAAQVVCCGRDEADLHRRAERIGRSIEDLRADGLCGTPSEVVDKIGRFAEAGTSRLHLQFLDMADLDHVDLVAAEVGGQLPESVGAQPPH
jgi:F420-dependent oxidoreductase-like protein